MALAETTKNLLTTIAENQPKVKQQGYDEGKQAEYDAHWNGLQNYGNRMRYSGAFAWWGVEEVIPKHKIIPTDTAQGMFAGCRNLKRINKEHFDLSKAKYYPDSTSSTTYTLCEYCNNLEVFPDIGLQAGYYGSTFSDNSKLHTIEILRSAEDSIFNENTFRNCKSLVNLIIEGVIGRSFNIRYSPLSIASLKSIITHLKPYYGTDKEFTYTVTFKTSAWEALEEAGFTDEDYQWVFDNWGTPPSAYDSWETLMGGWLGWNLVLA